MAHTFTVEVTDEEYRILCWQLVDPDKWVDDAVRNKIYKSTERAVVAATDLNVTKLTHEQRLEALVGKELPAAKDNPFRNWTVPPGYSGSGAVGSGETP